MSMFTRPLVDLMVAEATARKAAVDRGDDPEHCPEVRELTGALALQRELGKRVDGPSVEHYDPTAYLRHRP
ncbi:hypothetical protein [Mycolicibacter arupensis]|jgi:hypothetical protein|uniref:Uncharacterized protein n=1 Tax=Mycolicibacter arupensis TaxID=342002 RepID=A0A5C7Y509_9MYCO|nr:hypothetical protein [Mycolicibacter arupensis]TXI56890.1 MAG: hypothetical protein E6Q54_09330 [Mycolicibacter arupensis]